MLTHPPPTPAGFETKSIKIGLKLCNEGGRKNNNKKINTDPHRNVFLSETVGEAALSGIKWADFSDKSWHLHTSVPLAASGLV